MTTELSSPLSIANVSMSFGKKEVLNNISLELREGESFGLIGLNGIGKTTLIKIILDLLRPTGGEVSMFDISSAKPESRRAVSYLPEKFQPSRYLRGHEYLELSLSYYGLPYHPDFAEKEAVKLALDPSALGHLVGSYSKGMGQKLGLLSAIMSDTPLMMLDEPMSGLDPRARILLKDRLQEMKAEGRTLFFSSHVLSDIDEICDRIGVLHNGELLFVGTPEDFRNQQEKASLERSFLRAIDEKDAA